MSSKMGGVMGQSPGREEIHPSEFAINARNSSGNTIAFIGLG
jgi:hypothetical protein